MGDLRFRNIQGTVDANALLQIHALYNDIEGLDPVSSQTYRPALAWYHEKLGTTNPADWILAEWSGTVVGYGQTRWDWAERDGAHVFFHAGWITPEARGKGIGTELLVRLEARCREKAAGIDAARTEFATGLSAREQNACLHLESSGYTVAFTSWEMELEPGRPIEAAPMPDGYDLRPMTPEHHLAVWQCIGDAYDASCPEGRFAAVPTEVGFHGHFDNEIANSTLSFVAWQGSRVAGQVLCRVHENYGEVFEVSIGVGHRRRGLAKALVTRGIDALRKQGVPRIRLGTRYEYPGAWQLYEQVGFRRVGAFPRWRKQFTA